MDRFLQDLRYALRTFVRQPAVTATAVAALALGIGANTAVFSVVHAVLLKPLPYPDPEALIYVHDSYPAVKFASVSFPKYAALRERARSLDALGATAPIGLTFTGGGDPEQVGGYRVSADFFRTLRVPPLYGRWFTSEEDQPGGPLTIVLGHALWTRRLGADPRVVGRAITIDGRTVIVVGVMPPEFVYPGRAEAWVAIALSTATAPPGNFLRLVGRTRSGVSFEQARADLEAASAAYNKDSGNTRGIMVWRLHEFLTTTNRSTLFVLQGAVAFVLLIACANVANLLLARSVGRRRELAIRTALGAGRRRLARQLLTESVLLAVAGAATGLVLAAWLLRLFRALAAGSFPVPRAAGVVVDGGVLLFTLGVAIVTGLAFGIVPALRGIRADPNDTLRDAALRGASSGRARGASRSLVVAEVALAVVLVVGAALMVKSLIRLQRQDTGFRPENVVTFDVSLPSARYPDGRVAPAYQRLIDEIGSTPGVRAAGAISHAPLVRFGFNGGFSIEGRPPFPPDRAPVVEFRVVTPGYFETLGIPLRAGRMFAGQDTAAARPVVVINDAMAKQYWPNANPVGARVRLGVDIGQTWREIVGVVGAVRSWTLATPPGPETYVPHAQVPANGMSVVVRTGDTGAETVLPAIRRRVAAIDPALPLVRIQTMTAVIEASAGATRLTSTLTAIFALLAAVLATVGIYSLISYSVAQRYREIGIRVALGADRRRIAGLVLGEAVLLAGAGVAIGALGSLGLSRALATLLYEVSPTDPAVLAGTIGGVLLVALTASYVPARRATRVDPAIALRAE